MKTLLTFSSAVLFAAALSAQPPGHDFGSFRPGFAGPASRTPVTGAPYSAVETSQMQQVLPDGNTITKTTTVKIYRDSRGRVRTERTFTPPGSTAPETSISIMDPVAGYAYVLNPSKMTAFKSALRQGPGGRGNPQWRGNRANAQVTTQSLGVQNINGVNATGTRTVQTIPAGAIGNAQAIQVTREVWTSSDLQAPVMIKSSDPRFGSTVTQLTNITQSEPDASLFQVPSTYTETLRQPGPRGMRHPPAAPQQ